MKEIKYIIWKEIQLDFKQKAQLAGILFYGFSAVFILAMIYKGKIQPYTWNASFWIIHLFVSVNTVGRSFLNETIEQEKYIYQLVSPVNLILSKILYHFIVLGLLNTVLYIFFLFFLTNPNINLFYFILTIFSSSLTASAILNLLSALSSKSTNRNSSLLSILSFPVLIPMLFLDVKITQALIDQIETLTFLKDILFLNGFGIMLIAVSVILFPILWQE